jgi:ketosteroid isomerase-like protein
MTFTRFEPQQFVAQGDTVVTLGHYTATTSNGGSFDSDFVMVFTIRDGRAVEFREYLDSAALNAAFAPAKATV